MNQLIDGLLPLLYEALALAQDARDPDLARLLHDVCAATLQRVAGEDPIRVDLLAGRMSLHGRPVRLTPAEFAVVAALALNDRGISRDALAELLYPDVDSRRAANTLKVYVHRVRRQAGDLDVIRHEGGRYALRGLPQVDLVACESAVRAHRLTRRELCDKERARLARFQRRLRRGRPAFMQEWDWFESVERRLCDLTHDVTVLLARDALRRGDLERAAALAAELAGDDPADEAAAEMSIRAFLGAGDTGAALAEYRRYAVALRSELGCAPSAELRSLIEAALVTTRATTGSTNTSPGRVHSVA